jgi:uncharacterized protein with GYD domain
MALFIMATKLDGEGIHPGLRLEEKEGKVMRAIKEAKLEVEWVANYAIMGPYDYIDVFRASDQETAMKVSTLVRRLGHAHTEIWGAMEWQRFKDMLTELPKAA